MKPFKVLSASALALTLFTSSLSVQAEETESSNKVTEQQSTIQFKMTPSAKKEKINKMKFGKDVTQEQIDNLSDELILELSKDEGEIVSINEQGSVMEPDVKSGSIGVMTIAQSTLKMTVVVQRISEKSGDNFKFVAEADWLKSPTYEFVDTIALAWSDSFTVYHDSSYMVNHLLGNTRYMAGSRNKAVPEVGVGHDVDLLVGWTDDKAILTAKVYKANSSGSANVVAEYGHIKINLSDISLGFSNSPNVTFSVNAASNIDTASPALKAFDY
jgi:hypothetical protein